MDSILYKLHLAAAKACGEDRSCRDKVRYGSEETARESADAMNLKGDRKYLLEHYPCPFCDGWHLGRHMSIDELLQVTKGMRFL